MKLIGVALKISLLTSSGMSLKLTRTDAGDVQRFERPAVSVRNEYPHRFLRACDFQGRAGKRTETLKDLSIISRAVILLVLPCRRTSAKIEGALRRNIIPRPVKLSFIAGHYPLLLSVIGVSRAALETRQPFAHPF